MNTKRYSLLVIVLVVSLFAFACVIGVVKILSSDANLIEEADILYIAGSSLGCA